MHKTSFIIKSNQYHNIGILNLFVDVVLWSSKNAATNIKELHESEITVCFKKIGIE